MDFQADFLTYPLRYIIGVVSLASFLILTLNGIGRRYRRTSIILSLVCLGILFSTGIFILHAKVEQFGLVVNLNAFLAVLLGFTIIPGGLAGVATGAWININIPKYSVSLLGSLLVGMLVYIGFITLFEVTEFHPLLYIYGPTATLLVYRFSPG